LPPSQALILGFLEVPFKIRVNPSLFEGGRGDVKIRVIRVLKKISRSFLFFCEIKSIFASKFNNKKIKKS